MYVNLRPADFQEQRFFLKYQNGKCYRMVMGIHKLGNAAKGVASYLNLPNWKEYTGHSLRRTSATLLVDEGGDLSM
jgi:integrase